MLDDYLFLSESNVANYTDDTTLYACEKKLYDVQRKLESESLILFEWFHDNYLKANSGKSHVMLTTDNKQKINVKGSPISNKKIVKLLGLTVDNKLSFEPHLKLVKNFMPLPEFQIYLKEKAKSYHEGIYNIAVQLLSFGMDVP